MGGPWEDYAATDGPWNDYKAASKAKPSALRDVARSGLQGLQEGVTGLADTVRETMGGPVLNSLYAASLVASGGKGSPFSAPPASAATNVLARDGYQPQTNVGKYARSIGQMAPNALAPGGLARRAAAVVLPGVTSEAAAQGAAAAGGDRLAQAAARAAGGLVGGVGAATRINLPSAARRAGPVAAIPRQDVSQIAARTAEYRASGINPTLVDVVDESGRAAIRVAASRMTPARQRATEFQDARALDLPSRVGGQARRVMSQDPRTPDEIRQDMAARRDQRADQAFGAVRGETVQMAPETVQALRNDYGRRAITEAANRERDPEVAAALRRLAGDALDNPSTPITVGMADRIARVLLGQAGEAARRGDNDLATTLGNLGRSVRGPTGQAVPGYGQALEDYAADSRLQEAAGVGENLMTRNTDEFVPQAQSLSDEERALALAAGRRAIERRAGENVGAAPGVARQIANAPEQQARNAALMGPERAQQLQQGMRLEAQAVRNANDIAPRFGSQTQNKAQDAAQMVGGVVRVGHQLVRSDYIGIGLDWLRSRGMNDQQAQALVNMAIDPTQVDQAIGLLTQRFGPQARQELLSWRNAAVLGASSGAIGARQSAPDQSPQGSSPR